MVSINEIRSIRASHKDLLNRNPRLLLEIMMRSAPARLSQKLNSQELLFKILSDSRFRGNDSSILFKLVIKLFEEFSYFFQVIIYLVITGLSKLFYCRKRTVEQA